jgi:hypothetical protein
VFSLSFIENPDSERFSFDAETEIVGKIRLGDFEEYFAANATFWSADEYRAQWKEGLSRVCDGFERSCVLTSVSNPETANYFQTWPIYRFGSEVIFQNRLLMLDQLDEPFLFSGLYDFVLPYRTTSEDGAPLSPWKIPVRAIQEFLAACASQ